MYILYYYISLLIIKFLVITTQKFGKKYSHVLLRISVLIYDNKNVTMVLRLNYTI